MGCHKECKCLPELKFDPADMVEMAHELFVVAQLSMYPLPSLVWACCGGDQSRSTWCGESHVLWREAVVGIPMGGEGWSSALRIFWKIRSFFSPA